MDGRRWLPCPWYRTCFGLPIQKPRGQATDRDTYPTSPVWPLVGPRDNSLCRMSHFLHFLIVVCGGSYTLAPVWKVHMLWHLCGGTYATTCVCWVHMLRHVCGVTCAMAYMCEVYVLWHVCVGTYVMACVGYICYGMCVGGTYAMTCI